MSGPYGTVYWLTGLSGAGKTTIGLLLYERLRAGKPNVVMLDGDGLRDVFDDIGYSPEERKRVAMYNARFCKMLSDQGIDVVCATISMSHRCREWSRANIPNYCEVYIRVPMEVLAKRDSKGLYAKARRGETANVIGMDVSAEEPRHPDLVIDNDDSITPERAANQIWEFAGARQAGD
ncbi:MAG: adenylyl-sulfate kinase [bacterium]